MRANGIAGITRRKRRNLTKPDKNAAAIPDLIRREFTAPMPGLKLIGDISCFPTSEGWLHLASVLDLCSKELILRSRLYRPLADAPETRFFHLAEWGSGTGLDEATGNPEWHAPCGACSTIPACTSPRNSRAIASLSSFTLLLTY